MASCSGCHGPEAEGSTIAYEIRHPHDAYAKWVVRNGRASIEFQNQMPQFTPELLTDPMSLLEFGSTREHNFLAWVDSSCQGSALAVVSLMHTGQVEVRLLRRGASTGDPPAPNQFGVFQLEKNDCDF